MKQTSIKIGLKFPPEKSNKPVVTELVGFGLSFNILRAYITPGKTGHLVLELTGGEEDVKKGIEFLEGEGITVTVFTESVLHYQEKCMHCGACTAVCPSGALVMNPETWELEFSMEKCVLCGYCIRACPARAIKNFEDDVL
jgi:ferredoxin